MAVSKDSKRIAVTISKEAYDKMVKIANKEGRTISNLASYLINQQLNRRQTKGSRISFQGFSCVIRLITKGMGESCLEWL